MTVPGEVLAGRYRLVHLIATGGMGSVWEARDELLHRPVAIKELLAQPGASTVDAETARSRVIREARITARLHHPHAVTLYDVIDHGGQPCLILQFVPSRTLNSVMAAQGLLQIRFVTAIGAQVASALAAAHRVGIIHRDVKPSNVLITPDGAAMITDFGISHAAGDISVTSTGMVSGTPAFLAPEVARGAPSGLPADVFSLGATLYAALEGTSPFGDQENAMAILHKVASGQVIPPRRSGTLAPLLSQMLAIDPAARPAMSTVTQLLTDVGDRMSTSAHGQESPTIAVPPRTIRQWAPDHQGNGLPSTRTAFASGTPATAASRRRRRVPAVMITAAALVLMLAGLGVWLLAGNKQVAQPAAGSNSLSGEASAPRTSPSATQRRIAAPTSNPPSKATPLPTTNAPTDTQQDIGAPTTGAPTTTAATKTPTTAAARTTTSNTPTATASRAANTTTEKTATAGGVPTAGQLAAAITDYYALLPRDTDRAWARLTSKFHSGTAQNREYYQRFWDSVQRVTATNAHGASPDTAEATITYYFKDGRSAVEPTVYSLVQHDGTLVIDASTVLTSTTQ